MKNWRLIIGVQKHWITKDEANSYLQAVQNGEKYFRFENGLTVITSFQELCPREVLGDEEKLAEGKWKCKFDKWHSEENQCNCEFLSTFSKPIKDLSDLAPEEK